MIFAGLSYALVGLRVSPAAFVMHSVILGLATLVAESLVLWVGAFAPDAKVAVIICPVLLSTSLLFGGLFVSLSTLPTSTSLRAIARATRFHRSRCVLTAADLFCLIFSRCPNMTKRKTIFISIRYFPTLCGA